MERTINSLCQRVFNPRTTLQQIFDYGKVENLLKWNVNPMVQCVTNENNEVIGITLKMGHDKFNDFIVITLSWDDTYRVYFFDSVGNMVDDISDVYFDKLYEVIDNRLNNFVKMEFCMN